jgi:hypothetical protein
LLRPVVEVVEVQQNLRIAIDSITRDVKMAGFLLPKSLTPAVYPVGVANANTITLNTASPSGILTTITTGPTTGVTGKIFNVSSANSASAFSIGDLVTIIRPQNRSLPGGWTAASPPAPNTCTVSSLNPTAVPPQIGLTVNANQPPNDSHSQAELDSGVYNAGDYIVRTSKTNPAIPSTVTYSLGTAGTCPANQLCLLRVDPDGTTVVAQNMASLNFSYLMDDLTEVTTTTLLSSIRSVRVTLTGTTVATTALTNNQAKQRTIESIIDIRNR